MGRKRAWNRKVHVSANRIQRCYRSYKARTGVIAFKNKLKKAVEIIGRRYKRRLELNMFKAVMAKCRRLRQAKLLQEAVHAENEKAKRDQAMMLNCTIRLQSFFRGWKARKLNPYKQLDKILKKFGEEIESGDEKNVKGMCLDLSELPFETTLGKSLNRKGDTFLHLAAKHGHVGICKILVNVAGLGVDTPNKDKYTPLHMAISNKRAMCARALLRLGADVRDRNIHGSTALHIACTIAEMECVMVLLKNHADPNCPAEDGSSPMHEAAAQGRYNIMLALEAKGGEMHRPDNKGRLPVMLAIQNGAAAMIGDLLKTLKNAPSGPYTINYQDNDGMTCLLHAALAGETDIARRLTLTLTLTLSLTLGETDIARSLCLEGSDIDIQDAEGWTAIHYAASAGDRDMLELLMLNYGGKVCLERP